MTPPEQAPLPQERFEEVPLDKARLHPRARKHDSDKQAELTASIKERGQLEPACGRPKEGYIEVYIGAGRYLACQALGKPLKVLIAEKSDEDVDIDMLHENLKREELDPITEAGEYKYLNEVKGWSHDQIAEKIGKSKTYVTLSLGLLKLPDEIQLSVTRGTAPRSLAEALLSLKTIDKQLEIGRKAIKEGWSVRKTEAEVSKELAPLKAKAPIPPQAQPALPLVSEPAPKTSSASPSTDEENPWVGSCHFKQDGAGMVILETFYERAEDPDELGERISSELSDWLESKEGSACNWIWLPETEEEMSEFENLAANSPGPGPLCAKVFHNDPYKLHQKEGVTWGEMKGTLPLENGDDPKTYARAMVHVVRQYDVPKWDRRWLPPNEPFRRQPPRAIAETPKLTVYPPGSNGGNGHH